MATWYGRGQRSQLLLLRECECQASGGFRQAGHENSIVDTCRMNVLHGLSSLDTPDPFIVPNLNLAYASLVVAPTAQCTVEGKGSGAEAQNPLISDPFCCLGRRQEFVPRLSQIFSAG
jgi:hypothetical protein